MAIFDLVGAFRRLTSLCSGIPPSLAWTVRSCRSSKSLRTNVLLHFAHLNGRSLVSVGAVSWSSDGCRDENGGEAGEED